MFGRNIKANLISQKVDVIMTLKIFDLADHRLGLFPDFLDSPPQFYMCQNIATMIHF